MRKKVGLLSILMLLCGVQLSFAQSDTTSNMVYDIKTDYQPKLSEARKVMIKPNIEPISSTRPTFDYNLPNFVYTVHPTYQAAKAISIKSEVDKPLAGNYFKLGAGNYLTPYAEFRVHSVRNKDFNYGAYGSHLSSNANNPEFADFSTNQLGVMGAKIGKKATITGKLNYIRNAVHFYGFDADSFDFSKDTIKQIYNDFNGKILVDRGYTTKKLGTRLGFDFYTFSTAENKRENDFFGKLDLNYNMRKGQNIKLFAGVDYTSLYEEGQTSLTRTFVHVQPSYTFKHKKIDLKIGANSVTVLDSNSATFRLFPDISAKHYLVKSKVLAYAEINGDVFKNSLQELAYINPFIAQYVDIKASVQNFNAKVGLTGLLLNKLDYELNGRFNSTNNMPLFLTDSIPTQRFNVVYDNVQTFAFHGGLGLRIDEKFFIQAGGTFYNYSTDVEAQAWQLPSYDADVNLRYTLAKKLNLRVQLYTAGQRLQLNAFSDTKEEVTLSPYMDLNVMADYRYKKNISFFINANNISNSRYQKWYAYPSFGLNLLAGITFSL